MSISISEVLAAQAHPFFYILSADFCTSTAAGMSGFDSDWMACKT